MRERLNLRHRTGRAMATMLAFPAGVYHSVASGFQESVLPHPPDGFPVATATEFTENEPPFMLPMTDVEDQESSQYCAAYSVAAAMNTRLLIQDIQPPDTIDSLGLWNKYKVGSAETMVSRVESGGAPSVAGTVWKLTATGVHKASDDATRAAMRAQLAAQVPLVIRIRLPSNFEKYTYQGIYNPDKWSGDYHALCIVGYGSVNDRRFWVVKNSYGVDWGDGGLGWFAWGDPIMRPEEAVLAITGVKSS